MISDELKEYIHETHIQWAMQIVGSVKVANSMEFGAVAKILADRGICTEDEFWEMMQSHCSEEMEKHIKEWKKSVSDGKDSEVRKGFWPWENGAGGEMGSPEAN